MESIRALSLAWSDGNDDVERAVSNIAGVPSRDRARDVVRRVFVPRLVESDPPNLWRVTATLERAGADRSVIVPLHYYLTADSEPLLWDFVVDELYDLAGTGQSIDTERFVRFIISKPDKCFASRRWTPTVATKVARGALAALRDYGVLTGGHKKRIGNIYLPVETFALLCRLRHERGYLGESILRDDVWKLFFLSKTTVERFLAEATAQHLLRYETAGPVVRIEFPDMSLEAYAGYIVRRTT